MPRSAALMSVAVVGMALVGCHRTVPDPGTPAPSVEASAAEVDVPDLIDTGQPLPAGRYTRTGFEPRIELELDGTWHAVQLFDGFFDVQRDPGSPDVVAVQFARPTEVVGADGRTEPQDAAEAADIASANPGVTVLEMGTARLGGLSGHRLTVANDGASTATIMQVPPGPLGIEPGRRLWIAFFDTDAGLLAIMVGGSTARWDEALMAAEPVLESVVIGGE